MTCPSGKLKTEFTSPIAKSTSRGLSDTTFFARCLIAHFSVTDESEVEVDLVLIQPFLLY